MHWRPSTTSIHKHVCPSQSLVAVVDNAGLVVNRFFATSNYSGSELKVGPLVQCIVGGWPSRSCRPLQLVVETLVSTKEPLTSFETIKDANVKELIIDNEGNLDTWRAARKAVGAIGLAPEVSAVLGK